MKLRFPPALKLLVRGYIVIIFILLLEHFGMINDVSIVIFVITMVSISMIFGVGYLLISFSKPVRKSNCNIPNTVLIFVKGALVLYFVSLLGSFDLLPLEITGLLMTCVTSVLVIFGVVSYLFEVFERATPVRRPVRTYYIRNKDYRDI